MDKKEFEAKFRSRIKPDTSDWRERPAANRDKRDEFKRSQRVAMRILDFLENNPKWSRQRLAEELGVSLQRISTILKGKANFTLNSIETLENVLGINLLDERKAYTVTPIQQSVMISYGASIQVSSVQGRMSAIYFQDETGWSWLGTPDFKALLEDVINDDSPNPVAA
mgnify:CR=1 FL=1